MMTRLVLVRTVGAVVASAAIVGTGIALWSIAATHATESESRDKVAAAPSPTIPQQVRAPEPRGLASAPPAVAAAPARSPEPMRGPAQKPAAAPTAAVVEATGAVEPRRIVATAPSVAPPPPPALFVPSPPEPVPGLPALAFAPDPPATPLSRITDRVDLNKASVDQLNSLRGGGRIGRAIVQGRPYRSAEDLLRKKVVNRTVYERIKNQVTVR
jgi:DNA uptake protein ComE-like DNA-binding protein